MEKAIFTNMCMIENEFGQVLVQERMKKDWPGVAFPGGHVEKNESFVDSVIREVREETGLAIKRPVLCGVKQFQTQNDERYVVFLYKATEFEGTLSASDEGPVFWIDKKELGNYSLVPDFMEMVEVFSNPEFSEFFYSESSGDLTVHLK
ncbi:8-oxo-dGTP diphosphatase [Enterococcus sp. AZ194]|uniref:8-oxo-dGTP diphosphatase n=1 Tax=Enterococcus sp. AZ194 TaxID=2774629 RepID=UPI003F6881A8